MTMHEALSFIKALHDWTEAHVENPGAWCWPTRELLAENLSLNQHLFAERSLDSSMRYQMRLAQRRGWLVEGPCVPSHCHARHVRLTGAGLEMLALMERNGCAAEARRDCVRSGFKLHRKVAA